MATMATCEMPTAPDIYQAGARDELARMKGPLYDLLTGELGAEARDFFIEDWRSLTVVLDKGELRPARMRARKPAAA